MPPLRRQFPRAHRLTHKSEYTRVFSQGEKSYGNAFVCYRLMEKDRETRLGLVVSRKVGGAVVRNRVKRRLREFFRRHRDGFEPGSQVVVVARAACARLSGPAFALEIERQLRKHMCDG